MDLLKTVSIALLLTALAFSISCRKTTAPSQPAAAPNAPATTSAPAEQLAHPEGDAATIETRYFKGSIGSTLGLQMKLSRQGDQLTGSYFYEKAGTRIDLKGTIDKSNNVNLEEFDSSGKQTGIFKGVWIVDINEGRVNIVGNWTRPDGQKKTAFSLHEEPIQLSGGVEVLPKQIKESNKKLNYEIKGSYPQLIGLLSPNLEKFNQEVKNSFYKQVTEFKKNMSAPAEEEGELPDETSNSTLDISYTIAIARDDLISIGFEVGTYYRGAAHPNSVSQTVNYDVKNAKLLKLSDLFKPGAKYLQAVSAYCINDLKKQSKANNNMLDDSSIDSGAGASPKNYQSWTITKKGLGINFDPYQVGPYAAGPQYVLVPYSELKDVINPDGPLSQIMK
jgi:hypothetical protein